MAGYKQNSSYGFGGYGTYEAQQAAIAAGLPEIRDQSKPLFTPGVTEANSLQQGMDQDAGVFGNVPAFQSSYSKNYSGSDSGFGNSLDFTKKQNMIASSNASALRNQSAYEMEAYGPKGKNAFLSMGSGNPAPAPDGGNKYFTADNINAFGSAITGLGSLASGWAALKNIGIQKDALANQNQQWQTNYESQRTATNNQISNQNAFKKAQGRTDYGSYVGGKPTGTNYV